MSESSTVAETNDIHEQTQTDSTMTTDVKSGYQSKDLEATIDRCEIEGSLFLPGIKRITDNDMSIIVRHGLIGKKLSEIAFSSYNLSEDSSDVARIFQILIDGLKENTTLIKLCLPMSVLVGDGVVVLVDMLRTNKTLRNLTLCDDSVSDRDRKIQTLIDGLKDNKTLVCLIIDRRDVVNESESSIGNVFKADTFLKQLISMSNNLSTRLVRALTDLQHTDLDLAFHDIDDSHAVLLAETLSTNTLLKNLKLYYNRLTHASGPSFEYMLRINTNLSHLDLGCNQLSDQGACAIMRGLSFNTALVHLNLSRNELTERCALEIGRMLQMNKCLTHLYIGENSFGDEGVRALFDPDNTGTVLSKNKTLTHLDLNNVRMQNDAAIQLATLLRINSSLTNLNLQGNDIGVEGMGAFVEALRVNTTLLELSYYEGMGGGAYDREEDEPSHPLHEHYSIYIPLQHLLTEREMARNAKPE